MRVRAASKARWASAVAVSDMGEADIGDLPVGVDRPFEGRRWGAAIGPGRVTPKGHEARRPCLLPGGMAIRGTGDAELCDPHYIMAQIIDLLSGDDPATCGGRGRIRRR
jgi:hypothetical protein